MRGYGVRRIAIEEARNYGKNVYIKTFSKMAGGEMHISHPIPLDPPLAISYKNHQKSLAYFSHLAPLILLVFTKRLSQKEGHGVMPPPPLNTIRAGGRAVDVGGPNV